MAKKTNTLLDSKQQGVKDEIISLLRSTSRPGIDKVIDWLDTKEHNFFVVPAARLQHDNVKGGLASHSLKVYQFAKAEWDKQDNNFKKKYPLDSVIVSALLHDVCKKDVYSFDAEGNPISNRERRDSGHGHRSVQLLEDLGFELTPAERMAIKWHMGKYELKYLANPNQDITDDYNTAMQEPFCILIHKADTEASIESLEVAKQARRNNLSWNAQEAKYILKTGGRFAETKVRTDVYNHNRAIFNAWKYEAPSGKVIDLPVDRQELLDATKVYREKVSAAEVPANYKTTKTGCANEDCVVVAKSLIDQGRNPVVLNLADAYHACGKYNSGSNAQEESLCRASTLSLTLYQYYNKMWAKKANVSLREQSAYPMDIHFGGIYSPKVTVFRNNGTTGFALREEPFQTSIISVAALNFREGHEHNNLEYRAADGDFTQEGEGIMRDKIRTIYRIALLNGHDSIVLGAFGCGVFELKPELVSALFNETLEEKEFKGKFHTVVFALMEGPAKPRKKVEEEGKLGAFYRHFGRL